MNAVQIYLNQETSELIGAIIPDGKTKEEFCAELLQAGLKKLEQEQRLREDMKIRFIPPGWRNER